MIELDSDRIGLAGDVHGLVPAALDHVIRTSLAEVHDLVFLGDWGVVFWPHETAAEQAALKRLQITCQQRQIRAWVLLGNHEAWPRIFTQWAPDQDGVRWLRKNIGVLPRAGRLRTPSGATVGFLAGANSIDRASRRPGYSWHPDEQITDHDLATLGTDPVDVLLGHECPDSQALRAALEPTQKYWLARDLDYADQSRQQFQRAVAATTPKLTVGGHYHLEIDSDETFTGVGGPFRCRCVTLTENARTASHALLNLSHPEQPQLEVTR